MKAKKQKNNSDKKESEMEKDIIALFEKTATQVDNQIHAAQSTKNNEQNEIQRKLVRVGWASVVVNFVLAISTFFLYYQAVRQADAAVESNKLTKESFEFTREEIIRQQRPYVTVRSVDFSRDTIRGGIEYDIRNSGNSPAYDVRVRAYAIFTAQPDTIPNPDTLHVSNVDDFIPGHDQIRKKETEINFEGKEVDTNIHILIIVGRIEYRDSHDKFHWTNFGYRWIWLTKSFVPFRDFNKGDYTND